VVVATRKCHERRAASKTWVGVCQFRTLRGRLFSRCATALRWRRSWTERSLPFGKYWRSRHSVFVASALPRAARIGEEDALGEAGGDVMMVGHLRALVPRQGEPGVCGQCGDDLLHR